jgi:hypothetical protein
MQGRSKVNFRQLDTDSGCPNLLASSWREVSSRNVFSIVTSHHRPLCSFSVFFSGVIGRSIKNNKTIIGKVLTCNNPKVNITGNFTDAERRKNVDGLTSKRQLLAPPHCQIQFVILKDVVCWIFAQHMLYTRGVVVVFFASRSHSKRGRLHVFVTCSISLW